MNKRKLYLDFDGVILDTINVTYRMIRDEYGFDPLTCDRKKYDHVIESFYKKVDWDYLIEFTPEINNSVKAIHELIKSNLFDITVLTHVFGERESFLKHEFIKKNFGDSIHFISVPKRKDDNSEVNEKCYYPGVNAFEAILCDDYKGNLVTWVKEKGIGVHFDQELKPNNQGYPVINNLSMLIEVERKINEYNLIKE